MISLMGKGAGSFTASVTTYITRPHDVILKDHDCRISDIVGHECYVGRNV